MKRQALLLLLTALSSTAAMANDRTIPVPAKLAMSWGYLTNSAAVDPHRNPAVGFWQRSSGAKPGVGANFVAVFEYQLPEAPPSRLRSATFQFSGKPSQCTGAEAVVVDVNAYAGDGQSTVADATAGSRVAQMSADCTDKAAFSRPIDVTNIVRQNMVASGIHHVGFNVRKANNRQGPGLFNLAAGKLTVVIADQDIAPGPMAKGAAPSAGKAMPVVAGMPPAGAAPAANRPPNLADMMARRAAPAAAPPKKVPSAPAPMGPIPQRNIQ